MTAGKPRTISGRRDSRTDAQDASVAILIQADLREVTKGAKAHDRWLLIHDSSPVKVRCVAMALKS